MKFVLITLLIGVNSVFAQKDIDVSIDIVSDSFQSNEIQIDVLKFYISSVSLRFDDNSVYAESESYHLVNLDIPNVPDKGISEITFTIGTDSVANVSGAMDGDLDPILGMYWAWNSGYINFKVEGHKGDQAFEFHIGGYNGAQATARKFSYPIHADDAISIQVDPYAFINRIDLKANHSIMIPGVKAVSLTDNYQYMLRVE